MKQKQQSRKILLVSLLPPPQGGIAIWTDIILREAKTHPEIQIFLVDIAPRWRELRQREVWRRIFVGGFHMVQDVFRALKIIREENPAVLHLCTPAQLALFRDYFILQLARIFGMRRIYHLRFGRLPDLAKSRGWEWKLISRTIPLADLVIALDRHTLQTVREQFPNKPVTILPNCLDPKEFDGIRNLIDTTNRSPGVILVSYIGYVIPTKGVLELVEAALNLAHNIPFELELIGPATPKYLKLIEEKGALLGSRLLIRGEYTHTDVLAALARTDILVLPSYTEGFPNVVMEAMALGKPVIGSDVGAIREMLDDERFPCGIVVPPKDSKALGHALELLISSPKLRESMGANARTKFDRNYSSRMVFEDLEKVWFPDNDFIGRGKE